MPHRYRQGALVTREHQVCQVGARDGKFEKPDG